MASNSNQGNEGSRRTGRRRDPSDRARNSLESGEKVPGIPSQPSTFASSSPFQQREADPRMKSERDSKDGLCHPDAISSSSTPEASEPATNTGRVARVRALVPNPIIYRPFATHPQTLTKMRTRNKDRTLHIAERNSTARAAQAASSFMLAGWPRPLDMRPEELDAQWMARRDEAATTDLIETYCSDGADDWEEFAGNRTLYLGPEDLERAVGSSFVNRAKRAFRMSKSWAQFEAEEMAIDSMQVAHCEQDAKRRRVLMQECLNNGLRLWVFEQLKERLCGDIWHEDCESAREEREAPPIVRVKKDSKEPSVTWAIEDVEEAQVNEAAELDEYSVVDWSEMLPLWHKPNGKEADDESDQNQ